MRAFRVAVLMVIMLTFLSNMVFAQDSEEKKESPITKEDKATPMGKEGMAGMMKKMDMMRMMMQKQMVASGDGGVIILAGNKLLKYDKDLNLVKEVELKTDMECMHKMMQKMKEKCAAQEKMTQGQSKEEEGK